MNKEVWCEKKWSQIFVALWNHIKASILSVRRSYGRILAQNKKRRLAFCKDPSGFVWIM